MVAKIHCDDRNKHAPIWVLEYKTSGGKRLDPVMGWVGSGDTQAQVKLNFSSLEEAKAYAEKNNIDVRVAPPPHKKLKIQAYADNFR